MTEIVRTVLFLGFVVTVMLAATRRGSPSSRKFVNLLLAYAACAGLAAGLLHREAWPFSRWLVFAYPEVPHSALQLRVYDRNAVEYDVDPRALEPFTPIELYSWLDSRFPRLSAAQQDEAAAYLLRLAEEGRLRAVHGERVGRFERYFGRAAAPSHFLFVRSWEQGVALPKGSFVGLRIYEDSWDVQERARDPQAFRRKLLYQFPRAP